MINITKYFPRNRCSAMNVASDVFVSMLVTITFSMQGGLLMFHTCQGILPLTSNTPGDRDKIGKQTCWTVCRWDQWLTRETIMFTVVDIGLNFKLFSAFMFSLSSTVYFILIKALQGYNCQKHEKSFVTYYHIIFHAHEKFNYQQIFQSNATNNFCQQ